MRYLPFTWVKDGKTVTITQTYLDRTEVTTFELDGKELKFYEDPADLTSYTVYTKRDLVIEETTAE